MKIRIATVVTIDIISMKKNSRLTPYILRT
jgi:hypothetical protein